MDWENVTDAVVLQGVGNLPGGTDHCEIPTFSDPSKNQNLNENNKEVHHEQFYGQGGKGDIYTIAPGSCGFIRIRRRGFY